MCYGAVSSHLVLVPGVIMWMGSVSEHMSKIKKAVGGLTSELAVLHMKGMLASQFTISRN